MGSASRAIRTPHGLNPVACFYVSFRNSLRFRDLRHIAGWSKDVIYQMNTVQFVSFDST